MDSQTESTDRQLMWYRHFPINLQFMPDNIIFHPYDVILLEWSISHYNISEVEYSGDKNSTCPLVITSEN